MPGSGQDLSLSSQPLKIIGGGGLPATWFTSSSQYADFRSPEERLRTFKHQGKDTSVR